MGTRIRCFMSISTNKGGILNHTITLTVDTTPSDEEVRRLCSEHVYDNYNSMGLASSLTDVSWVDITK